MPIGDVILGAVRAAQATRGLTVVLKRGASTTADVPALAAKAVWIEVGPTGAPVRAWCRDFQIAATDYRIDGQIVTPEKHDQIIETTDKVRTFEVLPQGGENHVRESDPHYQLLRIHTKRTAEAPLDG